MTIDQLYCSPTKVNDWEEDILGVDVLEDGEEVNITFSRDEETRHWDIMIVDKDEKPTAEIQTVEEEIEK